MCALMGTLLSTLVNTLVSTLMGTLVRTLMNTLVNTTPAILQFTTIMIVTYGQWLVLEGSIVFEVVNWLLIIPVRLSNIKSVLLNNLDPIVNIFRCFFLFKYRFMV